MVHNFMVKQRLNVQKNQFHKLFWRVNVSCTPQYAICYRRVGLQNRAFVESVVTPGKGLGARSRCACTMDKGHIIENCLFT